MLRDESSPSYEELFGELDFRGDDNARSVYSPAAYLVDLLALLEGEFDRPSLLERRPDLEQVLLDADNTFTETPYLDIVIQVLERLAGADPYGHLSTLKHPFGLPFSLPAETLKKYLQYLDVTPLELYRLFTAAYSDHDVVAREYLRMSAQDVDVVITSVTAEAELAARYGLVAPQSLGDLRDAERFAEAAGLFGTQLADLLLACPGVTRGVDGTTLEWGKSVPVAWLDRTHRFIRLSRMTGLGFIELGLALDSCCAGRIDAVALRTLAAVVRAAARPRPHGHRDLPAGHPDRAGRGAGLRGRHPGRTQRRLPVPAVELDRRRRARDRHRRPALPRAATHSTSPARSTRATSGCPRSGCCIAPAGSRRRSASPPTSCSTSWSPWTATRRCGGTRTSACSATSLRGPGTVSRSSPVASRRKACGWPRPCSRWSPGCRPPGSPAGS